MRSAGYLAIVGGILLFLGGAAGWGIFATIYRFIDHYLNITGDFANMIRLVFQVLIFLASLGGITVIIGGYAMLKGFERIGKVLTIIGCGTGILTLIWQLLVAYGTNTFNAWTGAMMTFTGIGAVLAIISQRLAK
jgi:hypothetical protein